MKKLAVLILVLILAFAAVGAMAEECAHQWENGTCTNCGQVCEHDDKIVSYYNFDWSDESTKTTYAEIAGDDVNHTETTTGPCTVTYYCQVCGQYVEVSYPSYTATQESRHSYDGEGVCSSCGHKNNCTHERQKEVIYVDSDEEVQYESISDYFHEKKGNGYKYTECEDCYQALSEYVNITDGNLTCEEEHQYSFQTDEEGNQIAVCDLCGWECTHEWGDNAQCSICYVSHDHKYDTSKADGVCTITNWDEHNGQNAKRRAANARRMSEQREEMRRQGMEVRPCPKPKMPVRPRTK